MYVMDDEEIMQLSVRRNKFNAEIVMFYHEPDALRILHNLHTDEFYYAYTTEAGNRILDKPTIDLLRTLEALKCSN